MRYKMVSNSKWKKWYENSHGNNSTQLAHIPMLQCFPVKPGVQLQLKSFIRSKHVPLMQGSGSHSSISGKEQKQVVFTFLLCGFFIIIIFNNLTHNGLTDQSLSMDRTYNIID